MIRTTDLTDLRNDLEHFIEHGWIGRAAVINCNGKFLAVPEASVCTTYRSVEVVTKVDPYDADHLRELSDEDLIEVLEETRIKNEIEARTGRGCTLVFDTLEREQECNTNVSC